MRIKLLAGAAVIAAGAGLSSPAPVHAAPPPPCPTCHSGPNSPQDNHYPWTRSPDGSVIIPPSGGGPKTGGRSVQQ
jgi:hypothetical protein